MRPAGLHARARVRMHVRPAAVLAAKKERGGSKCAVLLLDKQNNSQQLSVKFRTKS
jgi:hypothetical protein